MLRRLLIAPLLAALLACAPASAAAGGGGGDDVDALLLGDVHSPVLDKLRDVSDFDATRPSGVGKVKPRRYDVLITDADRLSHDELGDVAMVQRFLAANGFVMILDTEPADHAAIARYISFDLSAGAGGEGSEMVMVGNSDAGGPDEMLIVNSGNLLPEGAGAAPAAEVRELKELAARRAAIAARDQIEADRTNTPVEGPAPPVAARATPQLPEATTSCTGDKQLCDISAQHITYHVDSTPQFSARLPNGYWWPPDFRSWNRNWPNPGVQEASWQSDDYFDLYLDNDSRPQGDNQVIVYRHYSTFNPARTNTFFHMDDVFSRPLFGSNRYYERAWWTGTIGVNAEPIPAAPPPRPSLCGERFRPPCPKPPPKPLEPTQVLTIAKYEPTTPNERATYSTGTDTTIGIQFTSPDGGAGASATWSVSQSQSTTIPSWSWDSQVDPASRSFRWLFSARDPCDARPQGAHGRCFDVSDGDYVSVKRPAQTSLDAIRTSAYGRWDARVNAPGSQPAYRPLSSIEGPLRFRLSSPITLIDSHCTLDGEFDCFGWHQYAVNADKRDYGVDPSVLNPCPDSEIETCEPVLKPELFHCDTWEKKAGRDECVKLGSQIKPGDSANGYEEEKIVGRITLARSVAAGNSVDVIVTSDRRNAQLQRGTNDGNVTRGKVTIGSGNQTGTFVLLTNDDEPIRCTGERAVTATIRAFYVKPATGAQLRVERPVGTCD